jgi:hypothetical protein
MIVGFKKGGIMGAIKAMFFGNGKGGLGNAIAAAFSTGATFAAAGLLVGGPVGALVGGLIGMTVGAVTGFLGKEKVAKMMSGAGHTIGKGIDIISAKINSIGTAISRYIYTPGSAADPVHGDAVKATMFGGKVSFHMPKMMTDIGKAVGKVWQGVKDFGTAVKNAVIMLLPAAFTDFMGWTVNGMVKGENANAPGAHHANYEKYNDGTNHGLTMAAASQVEAFTAAVKEQVDYVASFDSEGRRGRYDLSKINDAAYTLADGTSAEEFNNKMKSTGHSRMGINTQDLGDNMAMGPNRRYARGERIPPANVIVKQPDTNINTDQSVGAVIVNNNYFQDSPGGAADIHTIYSPAYPGGREMPWFIRGGTQ